MGHVVLCKRSRNEVLHTFKGMIGVLHEGQWGGAF